MYYIILNPNSKSGRGIKIWKKLEPVFTQRGIPYKLFYSRHYGHISELVHKIESSHTASPKPINIILLGGDGTLNEALQGVSDFSRVNFGYIPTGSSNDFARDIHLPKSPVDILELILKNADEENVRLHDLGILNYVNHETSLKRYFSVSTGIGFDAAVCEEAMHTPLKNVLNKLKAGRLTYLIVALKQLIQAKSISCDITLDAEKPIHLNRFLFVASMLHQYEGGGFKFCPGADATDGILNLCVVGRISKPLILIALPTAFLGKHYLFPSITAHTARKIEIKTSAPLWIHTDGEVSTRWTHVTISCESRTLRLLV